MRKLLSILLLLVCQVSFSQIENEEVIRMKSSIFNVTSNKQIKQLPENIFPEVIKLNLNKFKNNSEGKFSLNDTNESFFTVDEVNTNTSLLIDKKGNQKEQFKSENIETSSKTKFVNKVIQRKIAEEIQKYIALNEALTYGDRYLYTSKDILDLENKLIISKKITSEIELQIGKDIYPYLKKIQKTELDKTLQNSLNLFAINF